MSSDKQPLIHGYTPSAPPPPAYQAPPAAYGPAPPAAYAPAPAPQMGYGGIQPTTVIMQPPKANYSLVDVKPPNYLILSIITMLCFCWIFGLIALIVGSQVDSAWGSGDVDTARQRSVQARMWNIVGMVVGVVIYVGVVILSVSINAASCYDC